jgi:3',5'-cyclic AMP phosphodiesterase CpdA
VLTILHISDLHFGPYYVPRVGEALVEAVHGLEPDILVNSGDFTQRAKREQFEEAWRYMARMPDIPTVVVPGNHDVPLYRIFERLFTPHALYREFISPELDTVLHHERATIVALDSTAPHHAITNGRLTHVQLDLCARIFAEAPRDAARIVVTHHHLAPAPDYEGGQLLPRARHILERLQEMGVEMIMGGHLHRAYIGNSLDVHPGGARDRGIIIVQAGTSASRRGRAREREKNSFNLIRITDGIVRVTHYMFSDDLEGFAPISRHTFPRPGKHWLVEVAPGGHDDLPRRRVEG